MITTDTPELISWQKGLEEKLAKHREDQKLTSLPVPVVSLSFGKKYIRVKKDNSAYCFISIENGDILKPAGFNAPAKHARGNIFAPDNGQDCLGPYSVDYLRGYNSKF